MSKPQPTGSLTHHQHQQQAKRQARQKRVKPGGGDNLRRYRAVLAALRQAYPVPPSGNLARHLNTLAWLISGIVGSRRTNYPEIAQKCPDGNQPESRVKHFSRWVNNEQVEYETYFAPYVVSLLVSLAQRSLVLAIDGSEVGRGCLALLVNVIYRHRALPLGWVVVKGSQGHFPEESHIALVARVASLLPPGVEVIFLGDGEFDGVNLQAAIAAYGWAYVCRTAHNAVLNTKEEEFRFKELGLRPGQIIGIPNVAFTEKGYGPVQVAAWWAKRYKEPIYLVTNLELAEEACYWYKKRFGIETFFSDQKSRGFHLHQSHLADPDRLATLMIAACLAYIWMVYLGTYARRTGGDTIIHRTDCCDLSLFQLGLRLLEHFLNEGLSILVAFYLSV